VSDLDIGEVAQRAGIPASTLRFYEEKGLVTSVGRRGLRRLYDPAVLDLYPPVSPDLAGVAARLDLAPRAVELMAGVR